MKEVCRSNRYLVSGPSDACYLLHPAPWSGCGVIGQDWARGGSDWTAIRKGKGTRDWGWEWRINGVEVSGSTSKTINKHTLKKPFHYH